MQRHIESEMSVLGACLLDSAAIDVAMEMLEADDFYVEKHRHIFGSMVSMAEEKKYIDTTTLSAELQNKIPVSYLLDLINSVPMASPEVVRHYAKTVKDKAIVRRISEVAYNIIDKAKNGVSADELAEFAETEIFNNRQQPKTGPQLIKHAMKKAFKRMELASKNSGKITGLSTGIDSLDYMLCGLNPGKLYLIAARPAMGKTALAMNILESVSIRKKVPALAFSLEMPDEELAERGLCSMSSVDASRARLGILQSSDFNKLFGSSEIMSKAPLWIDESAEISISEIRSRARRLKRREDIQLIVVDYLQLVRASKKAGNREQEIAEISRGLKAMAKDLNVPVVALSQLNRSLENRTDKHPIMADLRESGSLEQDADVVMFIYRDAVYCDKCRAKKPCDKGHETDAEIIVSKQRGGPTGVVNAVWLANITKFVNKEDRREEPM